MINSNKDKPNLLFISSHVPSPDIPQAGHKLAYESMIKYSKEYNIYLIAFINEIEQKTARLERLNMCAQVTILKCERIQKILSILIHPWLPLRASTRINRKAIKIVRNIVKTKSIKRFHFEYSEIAYLEKYCRNGENRPLVIQDVLFQGLQRKAAGSKSIFKLLYQIEASRQKKWESRAYDKFDTVQVLAQKDKDILISIGIKSDKIIVVPPRVDGKYYSVDRCRIEKKTLLFFAAFNRPENSDGAFWFIKNVFPLVKKEIPDIVVYFVGAYPPPELQKKSGNGIVITGFVENPISYFEKCQVAIAPLRLGAGVKIKVLEYVAAGIPVVSTSVGAEGIIDELITVADSAEEFALSVCRSIKSGL
jgi:polysaccharide biosynthesis protein PslH